MSATTKPKPKEKPLVTEVAEEIEEIIEEIVEPPKKASPMVPQKRFENKLDLSPIVDQLTVISDKLETVLKPKEIIPPKEEPKPEPRKYRLFDEFDPSIEM